MSNYIKPVVFCEGCLSTDRKLTAIGQFYDIFVKFLDDEKSPSKMPKRPLLCWECNAMLRNIHKFRERVKQANIYLNEGLRNIKKKKICLSNLVTSNVTENIIYAIYCEENNDVYGLKEEDIVADNNFDYDNDLIIINEPKDENDLKTEKNECDFKNDSYTDDVSFETEIDKEDQDYIEDTKDSNSEKSDKGEVQKLGRTRKRRVSFTNVRYTVKELSKEEMCDIRKKCVRVVMDDHEVAVWREKLKLGRYHKTWNYRCETCISGFSKKQYYDLHMRKRHSKSSGDYECDICKQIVPNRRVNSHIKLHRTKFICSVCKVECYPRQNLDVHLNSMHKTIVECMECGLQFRHRMECNTHYNKTHRKTNRIECNECGNGFTSKKRLIHHIKIRHTEHRCTACDKVYACFDALKRHKMAAHVKNASEEAFCVECNIQFNNEFLFQQHYKWSTKHRQKRFPCPKCDKVYHKRTTLNNHYNYIHLQKTKNYCELCDRYFLTGYRLRQHKAYTHDRLPKTKTKMCSICGRAFNTNRILQNHIRTHTGERPFQCEYCTAAFTQKNALVSHTKAIHKIS